MSHRIDLLFTAGLPAYVKALSSGLTCAAMLCSLSCGLRSTANLEKANVNSRKDPLTLAAPTREFVVGKWQRTDASPGDWVFEFRPDGRVTFSVMLQSVDKLNQYEGTYFYSASSRSSVGWVTFKTLDGAQLEKPVGYDVKLSETGDELLISSIESGDRRSRWDSYRRTL
jgi:hypothetical protein